MSAEITRLRAVNRVYEQLSTQLDARTLLSQLAQMLVGQFHLSHAVFLLFDPSKAALDYGAISPRLTDLHNQTLLETIFIPTHTTKSGLLSSLMQGHLAELTTAEMSKSVFALINQLIPDETWMFVPLSFQGQWQALTLLAISSPLSDEDRLTLQEMLNAASSILYNAHRHMSLQRESEHALDEMRTFQQIDAELNDTIELPYVFRMLLDWALRFTRADAAIIGLYDEASDVLEILLQYGYDSKLVTVGRILKQDGGVSLRVARQKRAAMIPDVSLDKDYYPTSPQTRSLLSVPILREERVVAVMTLESGKLNGFGDEHLIFARKLASRAGVTVHNARLFSETQRERHKLAMILRHIADLVVVMDDAQHVILLNHSALQVFGLSDQKSYVGEPLSALIPDSPLVEWLNTPDSQTHSKDPSLRLSNGRIYNISVIQHPDIGQMVVLQDVTYFKEMDQLKSELVTTVTHDLKQPLSIMRGYLDLLTMSGSLDERSKRYVASLEHSFGMMRQLIDDLLDMARIESGIQLSLRPMDLNEILQPCLISFSNTIEQRQMTLEVNLPTLPLIEGDGGRLMQVFQNLVSNAIKYTPTEGHIRIWGDATVDTVQIHIQDSGIGMNPEDLAHIFERFFRVRNAQTAKIEGTGLGLAIVQSLVQAHSGTIHVESERGVGSVFTVSLPIYKVQPSHEM